LFSVLGRKITRLRWPTQWVRGTALTADRHAHQREFGLNHASGNWPGELLRGVTDPTSVTQVQPGGSPSSLERVEVIGSSFPLEATGERPTAVGIQVSASLASL
jgi:hypothetical protein